VVGSDDVRVRRAGKVGGLDAALSLEVAAHLFVVESPEST